MSEQKELKNRIIEALSSEHTAYKSTKHYLSRLPTEGKHVIQGPGENSGIVDIGDGYAVTLRMESHNHPSFKDPFQGAASGVGGILRDTFTMGARPIALIDCLRFGQNEDSMSRILPGVVRGISRYGNTVGVPVVGGDVYIDRTYDQNPLVNVGCVGLVRKNDIIYGHALTPGNDLIYVGARTGRDGLYGAEMASESIKDIDPETIQDTNPVLENLLLHACCEMAETTSWIEGMQDMGAAGILCSTTEPIIRGRKKTGKNLGARVNLDVIPQKVGRGADLEVAEKNLSAEELLLSESQERMLIIGKRPFRQHILKSFHKKDLLAVVCGTVTNDGKYTLEHTNNKGKQKLSIPFKKLSPDLRQDWPETPWIPQKSPYMKPDDIFLENIWSQYDWRVGTRTLTGPDFGEKSAILDIFEAKKELILAWSSDEGLSNYSPKDGVRFAFDNCFNKIISMGGKPLGLTNCLNFGHPADSIGAFAQTIDGLAEMSKYYNVPIVSGNVSLYNSTEGHSIKPTPVILMVGIKNRS